MYLNNIQNTVMFETFGNTVGDVAVFSNFPLNFIKNISDRCIFLRISKNGINYVLSSFSATDTQTLSANLNF